MSLLLRRRFPGAATSSILPKASGAPVGPQTSGVAVGGGYNNIRNYSIAQRFTTVVPVTVDKLSVSFNGYAYPGGLEMGIASSPGSSPSGVLWLSDGTNQLKTAPFVPNNSTSSGESNVLRPLPARMLLPAGSYWLVLRGTSGSGAFDVHYGYAGNCFGDGAVGSVDFVNSHLLLQKTATDTTWTTLDAVYPTSYAAADSDWGLLWTMTHGAT